jgi:long-chain acyl-CoA synthetase
MALLTLEPDDLRRICRDLAFSELATLPATRHQLGERLPGADASPLRWGADGLDLDSLAAMQLATAAATWCNAYDAGFEDLFLAKRSAADWAVAMRRARESGARHITFASSGSTGVRKHIRHQEDLLADEAQAWRAVLTAPSPREHTLLVRRVITLVPTHHIYGFIWGVLLPQALGVPVCDALLSDLPEWQNGDLIVGMPDQWDWLSRTVQGWPAGVQGVSSTAPLPDAVHVRLTSAHPPGPPALARLLQIYGSTETAGLAYRDAPQHAYTLAPGRVRDNDTGVGLRLADGTVAPLSLQDELQWIDERRFHLLQRHDGSVQVGGHNVSPGWVEARLRTHPNVVDAAVRLDTQGTPPRLKAFIVPSSTSSPSARPALEAWIAQTLPWYATFGSITYGSELPRSAMGKPCDWPV